MELLRSLLFIPANRPTMMEKARTLPADVLMLDLEDSVPLEEKGAARSALGQRVTGFALRGQQVYVRVNALATGLAVEDLEATLVPGVDGISLPKVESAEEIERVASIMTALEQAQGLEKGKTRLIPWVESAKGIVNAYHISAASPRIIGVAFGAEDFTLDMGIPRTMEGTELSYPRAAVAVATRAAGVAALDTPYPDFKDEQGLVREVKLTRSFGYQGKFVIHPGQIEVVNHLFRPPLEEVEYARKVWKAFVEAEARGSASTSLEGKMIDVPVANRARKLIDTAEAIARKEAAKIGTAVLLPKAPSGQGNRKISD